jgi:hypothetical protein
MDKYKIDINFVNKTSDDVVNTFHYENILATSFTKHTATGIDGHEQSTLNVTLKPDEVLFRALLNNKRTYEIQVIVTVNDTNYFTGIMRDTISYNINEALQPISFQVLDYSYKLETKPLTKSILYDFPVKIYNGSVDGDEVDIITTLVAATGIDVSNLRLTSILDPNFKIGYFKIDTDETYADMLDDLCEQYGLSYYFKNGNEIKLVNLFPETIVPAYTLTDSQLLQPLTIEKQEIEEDGVTVTWKKTAVKSDRYVFRQFSEPEDEELIVNGYYFPANANNEETYQTLSNVQDIKTKLIDTSNERVIFLAEEGVNLSYENYDTSLKARVYFKNNATDLTSKHLYNFDIKADIVTLSEEYTHTISGDNIQEFDGSYIDSKAEAEYLANIIKSKQENQIYKLNFSSKFKYNVGQFIQISDTTTGINLIVFIETQDKTANNPIYSYTGTSASNLTFVTSTFSSTVPSDSFSSTSEVETLTNKLNELNEEVDSTTGSIRSIEDNLLGIITRVSETESDTVSIVSELSTQASSIASNKTSIETSLATVKTELEGSVTSLNTELSTQASTITLNKTDIETALDNAKDEIDNSITEAKSAITSLNSDVDDINNLATAQGLSISQNATDIALKANQTSLNSTNGNVISNTSAIGVNATAITSKVSQTDYNTLSGTVSSNGTIISQNASDITSVASRVSSNEGDISTANTSITQNATAIGLKASQINLNSTNGNVSSNTSSIGVNATAIISKANQTDLNKATGDIASNGTSITQNATAITSAVTRLTNVEGVNTSQGTSITQNASGITSLATRLTNAEGVNTSQGTSITQNASGITSLATRLTNAEGVNTSQATVISQNADNIELKATKTEVNTLSGTVSSQGTSITANSTAIGLKASQTDLNSATGDISTNETAITQNADDITSVASRVTSTEGTITSNTSSISQNATDITSKVSQIEVDTSISNAKSDNHGYKYHVNITVNGDSDKMYPVVIKAGDQSVKRDILVTRLYYETAPPDWYTSTHKGGLTLKLKANFGGWGGANYGWEVHELEEMYSKMFGGCVNTMSNMAFAVFLRGGGAVYHLYSDQSLTTEKYTGISPQICYDNELLGETGIYSWNAPDAKTFKSLKPDTLQDSDTEAIKIRKFIKLSQTNSTSITQNASSITSLASRVTETESDISSQATSISQNASNIALKASQTSLNTATGNITSNTSAIGINSSAITSAVSRISSVEGVNTSQGTSISQNATAITSKASTSALNTVDGKTNTNAAAITQNADDITAVVSSVSANGESISASESVAEINSDNISLNTIAINTADGIITSHTSAIEANTAGIKLKVSYTNSEGNLASDASIKVLADANDASKIILDAEEILLEGSVKASKIDVDNLFSKTITVNGDDGVIKSANFGTGTGSGFSLDSTGLLQAREAILKNIRIEVGDENDKLFWVQKGQDGTSHTISASSPRRFSIDEQLTDYHSAIVYDGQSGTNSGINKNIETVASGNTNVTDLTITIPTAMELTFYLHEGVELLGWQTVVKNGTTVFTGSPTTQTYTATFAANDVVQITGGYRSDIATMQVAVPTYFPPQTITMNGEVYIIQQGYWGVVYHTESYEVVSYCYITPDNVQTTSGGSVLFTTGNTVTTTVNDLTHRTITATIKEYFPISNVSNKSLSIGGVSVVNKYTNMNSFVGAVTDKDTLFKIDTDNSTLYEYGVVKDFRYISVSSANVLTFIDENDNAFTTNVDGVSNSSLTTEFLPNMSWGLYNGTIKVFDEERGIICDTLLPFVSNGATTSNIGSAVSKFAEIHTVEIHATDIYSTGTSGQFHGKVYAS